MKNRYINSIAISTFAIGTFATAQDQPEAVQTAPEADFVESLAPLVVIGGKEEVFNVAGAAAYVEADDWRERGYSNINRILARVPGVYVRDEDGYGNFPNISIRGADGTRSEKVTLMEDGILSAPAPYSAPAAYYSPRAARMSGIEILKGSSQIKYGPQTTAGAINYLSTPIPGEGDVGTYWRSTYGSYNHFLNHAYHGDTIQTQVGTFGYLFEVFHETSDGFRDLDGGGDTGFEVFEPMVKFFWEPNTDLKQRFEFKYGYTDFEADETYVGLSEADFNANPYRRYAGTQFDNMMTEQNRSYLKWIVEPTEDLSFETAIYYNDFARNWYKIRGVDVSNPGDVTLLKGLTPGGTIGLRANDREYEAYGVQFSGLYEFQTGLLEHDLGFGVRYHKDESSRLQRDDTITSNGTGGFTVTNIGAPGSGGNRLEESEAIALWVSDEINYNNFTLTPGFRYETIDLFNIDYLSDATYTPTATRSGDESYFAPGVGFAYRLNDCNRLFGGVHKGYSIAGPRSILRNGVEKEESIGYELGFRHRRDAFNAELVGFLTDFQNLIATNNGFGISNSNRNVGEAEVWGLEGALSYDAGLDRGLGFGLPMYVSATWTSAELKSAVAVGGGEGIYGGAVDGSEIPYVPEWKLAAGIGVEYEKWGANLDAYYTSSTFGTANNLSVPTNNQREGDIDAAFLVDLSGHYQVKDGFRLVGGIKNLFDEEVLASRIPLGARAAAPRTAFAGIELSF